jgi:hypothetical protein
VDCVRRQLCPDLRSSPERSDQLVGAAVSIDRMREALGAVRASDVDDDVLEAKI